MHYIIDFNYALAVRVLQVDQSINQAVRQSITQQAALITENYGKQKEVGKKHEFFLISFASLDKSQPVVAIAAGIAAATVVAVVLPITAAVCLCPCCHCRVAV